MHVRWCVQLVTSDVAEVAVAVASPQRVTRPNAACHVKIRSRFTYPLSSLILFVQIPLENFITYQQCRNNSHANAPPATSTKPTEDSSKMPPRARRPKQQATRKPPIPRAVPNHKTRKLNTGRFVNHGHRHRSQSLYPV